MLRASARYIGHNYFESSPILDFKSENCWENDGAVSSYSRMYPHTNGSHPVGGEFDQRTPTSYFCAGQWYFQRENGVDYTDICVFPQLTHFGWPKRFYTKLFERLAEL